MAKNKIKKATEENEMKAKPQYIFEKKNYKVMGIGLAVIALGFILMAGGGSNDPSVFNPEIFSWRRIRLAPALVLIGFGIEIYAILLNPNSPKKQKETTD